MFRMVHGILFEGKRLPDAWDVRVWEKNGHRETSARQVIQWTEVCQPGPAVDFLGFPLEPLPLTPQEVAAKLLKNQKNAAARAQTMCRRVIKSEGFNQLLTITYRENQEDRALAKKHFETWVRRMKAALGGEFRYCASFERQERGAYHMHVACHKLPKHATRAGVRIDGWRLGTEVWRSVVGADNGLVFVGGKKKGLKSRKAIERSPAKMAQYVSKYILKDFAESPAEKNRYSRSNGTDIPKPQHVRMLGCLSEIISAAFTCTDGECMVSHRLGFFCDTYWLCTEPPWQNLKAQ